MNQDRANRVTTTFAVMDGTVRSYDKASRIYTAQINSAHYGLVECVQIEVPGCDAPFAVGDMVVLQRIPPSGVWVILGRIPFPRVAGQTLSYRQPSDEKDARFFTEDGDYSVRLSNFVNMTLTKAGAFVVRAAELCGLFMSKTTNLFMLTCQKFVVSMSSFVLKAEVDEQTLEPSIGMELTSRAGKNAMSVKLGGQAADEQDGLSLALGSLLKLLIQLLPGDTQLTYTQGTAKVSITVSEFLQSFGDGSMRWTTSGLTVTKGTTTLTIEPASLGISAEAMTLTVSTLGVNASGNVTISAAQLIQQNFYWLTVVQRLNQLLLVFSTHTHQAGPIQTSTPTGSPVNEKGTPIGAPILPLEPPLAV